MAALLFDLAVSISRVRRRHDVPRPCEGALAGRDGVGRHASAVSVSIGSALELGYGIRVNSVGLRWRSYAKLLMSKNFCDL